MDPFTLALSMDSGRLSPATSHIRRTVGDMVDAYGDRAAANALADNGDELVYEVQQYDMPEENGHLIMCTTVIECGKVGNEYFMTKGHFHEKRGTGEVYVGLKGHGKLLMQTDHSFVEKDLASGVVAYVPPYWAHRSVNTGDEPFIFLAVYPADAGHDYEAIERDGFRYRVIERDGSPVLAPGV